MIVLDLINPTKILKRDTLSDKTAIAVLEGLEIPEKLRQYSIATKSGMMDIETAEARLVLDNTESVNEFNRAIKDVKESK